MTARLFSVAAEVDEKLSNAGLRFCVIGGIAVQRWGSPRSTQDIDLTVLAPFGAEQPCIDSLLTVLEPRVRDAANFALLHRVLLCRYNGIPIDVSLGAMPFEDRSVEQATLFEVAPGVAFRTCGPSELLVYKTFAAREQDWIDIRGILVRSGKLIDWQLVTSELEPLLALKDDTASLRRLADLRQRT